MSAAALCGVGVGASAFVALPQSADAQPATGTATPRRPVLRTPTAPAPRTGTSAAPAAGSAAPATPTAPGKPPVTTGPGAKPGADPVDPNDPMGGVKQAQKEIDFKPKGGGFQVSFNLDDAELPELVKAISNITGKRFIYGNKLKQIKATVYAPEKVSAGEAYAAFLSILESNGLTVIPHGQFLKIVETQEVSRQPTPVFGTASPVPAEDRYVTRLYHLSNVDATEVSKLLERFKSKDSDITVYPPSNLLIITDTGTNLRRMLRIVEEVDVPAAGDQIWVQPMLNSSAADTATRLNEILGGGKGATGKGPANIIADERTNSLIITASKADYERLLELIKRIDTPMTGDGQLHVMPLQHALCSDLSNTLNSILGGSGTTSRSTTGRTGGNNAQRPATPPAAGGGGSVAGTNEDIFEGEVKVTCDETTNSLITTSSGRDFAQLRSVIDKLDKPRRQVFIEAVIMDLNVSRNTDWGIGYHGGAPFEGRAPDDSFVYGGVNPAQSVAGAPARLEALALGVRGPDIESSQGAIIPGVSIPALGVVLHAVATDGDSNVLATPHILAMDGEEAEISIGQQVPLQTGALSNLGSLANAAGGAQGTAALGALGGLLGGGLGGQGQYRDVGTRILVKPYINDSDQVRLELEEEISEVGDRSGALEAVTINKRTARTKLVVRDQQTVVIGGLMRDFESTGETKVPILGDIPILGFLFKQQVKTKQKTNLLLILTPYIIREQDDLRKVFERKMQERQEFLDRYFVFDEDRAWEPPMDFSRKSGLVEAIRQSMLAEDERAQFEEEAKPRKPKDHNAVEPIALPSMSMPIGGGGATTTTNPATPPATTPVKPTTPPAGGGARPRTPAPRDRVE